MAEQKFDEWLAALRYGAASQEWSDALAEVVTAVRETGKAGALTITIDVSPGGRTVKITDRLKAKIPNFDREETIWFTDDDGSLHRDDPKQVRAAIDKDNNLSLVTPGDGKTAAAGKDR